VIGGLDEKIPLDPEFQPGLAEHLHLGLEQEPFVLPEIHHLPDVQHVPDPEIRFHPPSHGGPVPAGKLVEKPPDLPEEIEREPPPPSPDRFHGTEYLPGRKIPDTHFFPVPEHGPGKVFLGAFEGNPREAVRPSADDVLMLQLLDGRFQCLFKRQRGYPGEQALRNIARGFSPVRGLGNVEAVGCQSPRQRGGKRQQERGKTGNGDRDRCDHSPQAHHLCSPPHHVLERHPPGPDRDRGVAGYGEGSRLDEIFHQIRDSKEIDRCIRPSGHGKQGELLDQISQDLECHASRTDEGPCPEPDRPDAIRPPAKDVSDRVRTRGQHVPTLVRFERADIDDPFHPLPDADIPELPGDIQGLFRKRPVGDEISNRKVDDVASPHRRGKRLSVSEIPFEDFRRIPLQPRDRPRIGNKQSETHIRLFEESRGEPPAYVPLCPRDENIHAIPSSAPDGSLHFAA
jgi:hypothetical protein